MLKLDKNDDSFIIIDLNDIIKGLIHAQKHDTKMAFKLQKLYVDTKTYSQDEKEIIKLDINNSSEKSIIDFLQTVPFIKNWNKTINIDDLDRSYIIATVSHNHQMAKTLRSYIIKYYELIINQKDTTLFEEEIKSNEKIMKFIKKYENIDEFLQEKINQKDKLDIIYLKNNVQKIKVKDSKAA